MKNTIFEMQATLQKTIDEIRVLPIISEAETACSHLEDELMSFQLWAESKLSAARDNIRIRYDIGAVRAAAQRSCLGCGWKIRNDLAPDGARERTRYCITCDPVGLREFSSMGS